MNRAARRALKKGGLKPGYLLLGGPMDSVYVTPDAPALWDDWHTYWPESVADEWLPGHYVVTEPDGPVQRAVWQVFEEGERV